MTRDRRIRFIVPEGIDEPARVSGGNVYDRHLRDGLRRAGWDVRMSDTTGAADVEAALAAVEPGEIALIDGLVAGWAPDAVESASRATRVVVIAHMVVAAFPGATVGAIDGERRSLRDAAQVIATSTWAAAELVRRGLVNPDRIAVVEPGSRDTLGDAESELAPDLDGDLLCVGVVAPHKGQDLLLDALDGLREHDWTCTVAGSQSAAPEFAARIASAAAGFAGRVRMTGVLDETAVDAAYRRAAVLVAPSRSESFGIALADARRCGLPIIATRVGGIPDTVSGGGAILVPHDDPGALADALRSWMTDPGLRARLRAEAARLRPRAPRWRDTVARVDEILVSG